MWNKLESLCAPKTGNNKMFLIKQMMELKYQDVRSLEYISR